MFTIKRYTCGGARQQIDEADYFTILRPTAYPSDLPHSDWFEVTVHRKAGDDFRFDVGNSPAHPSGGVWQKCIIENAAGRTTEIIGSVDAPHSDEDDLRALRLSVADYGPRPEDQIKQRAA